MHRLILTFLFITAGTLSLRAQVSPDTKAFFVIPQAVFKFLPKDSTVALISQHRNYHLVKMSLKSAEKFSLILHQRTRRCGGFFDVSYEMAKADFDPQTLWKHFVSPKVDSGPIRKTPKHSEQTRNLIRFIDKSRFVRTLTEFTAFSDRSARTETGVQAAEWLFKQSLDHAKRIGRSDVEAIKIKTNAYYPQPSVLVRVPGEDSSLPGILIGGHMDTLPHDKPGVDDDGSGVATTMEVYRSLLDSKKKFKRDIYFAYYAAEEVGLYGSAVVARQFRDKNIHLLAVLQFDMTAYRSKKDTHEVFFVEDYVDPNLTALLKKIATDSLGIPNERIGTTYCRYACSDHASWTRNGYPSAFPFEASFGNDNPFIHTAKDTLDKLDMDHAIKYVLLGAAAVLELAEPAIKR